jgi:uncharacterized protein YfaS (alpha-2-macroglobulin family)/TolA-binding protein
MSDRPRLQVIPLLCGPAVLLLLSLLSQLAAPAARAEPAPPAAAPPAASGDLEAFRAAREALADRDYPAAIRKLLAFRSEFPESALADDGEILLARAHQLSGDAPRALEALRKFVEQHPQSRFALKARFLMADAYLASRRFAEAAEIYRARLEFLRGDAYRDRIAGYYLEVADPAYAGRKVQDPSTLAHREVLVRDYANALEYYRKALSVMGAGKLRAARGDEIRYRIGHSLLELGRPPEAVAELTALIAERSKELPGPLLGEALFALAQAHASSGDLAGAVEAYARIENELGDHPLAPAALKAIGETELARADALGDEKEKKAAFERALAAFGRFLSKHPQHALAPEVAYLSGDARARAGDRAGAIQSFRDLVQRYPKDERAPTAQLRIAELLREEAAFDEAVAEWKRFLGTYPSDPRWSEAQERIEQALYQKGLHLLKEKKRPEEARAAWEQFLAERPASPLAPEVYRRFYEMALERKDYPAAVEALRIIAQKYPASPLAPSSQLLLAELEKGPLDDLEAAIREYEVLVQKFPQSQEAAVARAALMEMRGKHLALIEPRVYTTGEPWTLRIETRNIQKLKFKAYRVNLEEYWKKRFSIEGIEEIAVGVVEPTRVWDHEVGVEEKSGYRQYKLFASEKRLPLPEAEPGAYIITAEEDELQAVVLAVRSDLALVTKSGPRQTFVWAFDERSGEPRAGVRVLLADPAGLFFEGKTGPEGVLSVDHPKARPEVRVLALEPGKEKGSVHYASEKSSAPGEVAYGYTTKVHVTTDRPLYRPLQTVHFRAILRKVVEGRYQSSEGEKAEVTVVNPLGVVLYQETLAANEFGALAGSLELTDEPPLGEYQIGVQYQGQGFQGKFHVEEYRKPEFEVTLKPERTTYLRGEEVKGKISGQYLFGGPVARARVVYRVFEGPYGFDATRFEENRWFFSKKEQKERAVARFKLVAEGKGETDAAGELVFSFKPLPDGHDHTYRVQLEATDLSRVTVTGSDDVLVTGQEIYVVARADRKVYRPGDRVTVSFRTVDAAGRPLDAKGEAALARRVAGEAPGQFFYREVEKTALDTSGGKGEAVVRPKEPGEYRVVFHTKDRAGNLCEGGTPIHVAGDEPDLAREARLLWEKAVYHRGEEARLFLSSPVTGRHALLTFEAEGVISYKVIRLGERSLEIPVTMESRFSPNVTAAVAIPGSNRLHAAKDEAIVLEYLDVEVTSDKPEYRPGEEAKLTIRARDQGGRPEEAELSLAVIDAAILQLQSDLVEPVKPFFYDQRRTHAVSTGSSYEFSYQGTTTRKPEELLAEELRRVEEKAKAETALEQRAELERAPRAPAAAAPAPAARAAGRGGAMRARRELQKGENAAADKDSAALSLGEEEEGKPGNEKELLGKQLKRDESDRKKGPADGFGLKGGEGEGGPAPVEPEIRRNFADTALWRSDVRTGKDGTASVSFKVPDNLTSWRASLVGATRASAGDTLVGDGETRFRSKKGLLLRIQAPRFLTRADQASLTTPVHNYLPEALDVTLEMAAKDLEARSFSKTSLRIGAGDVLGAEWEVLPRPVAGGLLTARALSTRESDAIEQAIPIIPFGKRTRGGEGGLLADEALLRFEVPGNVIENTARVRVSLSPRFDDELRRAVLYLHGYPYGCVEQTVSGFVGLIALVEALDRLGTPDQDLRNLLKDQVPKRIVKVLNAQRPSGGWGWWGPSDESPDARAADRSDPRMTALALMGLERARLAGFRVQEDRLEKARVRSVALLKAAADAETGGLLAHALAFSKKAPPEELNRFYRYRESGSAYALGLLGLALEDSGQRAQSAELARLLRSRAQDLVLAGKVVGSYFPVKGGRENPAQSVLATAYGLMLLDRLEPEGPLAPRIHDGLLALRQGVHWLTTEATAAAVMALAGHAGRSARELAEAEVAVELNGEVLKTFHVAAARPRNESPTFDIPQSKLRAGQNQLVLRRDGKGRFGYTLSYEYFTPAEKIAEEGNLLKLRRAYLAYLPPRPVEPPAPTQPKAAGSEAEEGIATTGPAMRIAGPEAGWLLAEEPPPPGFRILESSKRPAVKPKTIERAVSGEKVRVVLGLEAREELEYIIVEDPIPAGCEVVDDPERFEGTFDRREVRDQRVVFFRSKLPRGVHTLSYLLRPTFPGRYRALPALATPMYEPGINGLSADNRLEIQRPEAREPEPPPELTADEKLFQAERRFATLLAGLKVEGPAERAAEVRQLYLELLSAYPLADPYQDLVLSRIVGLDLAQGPPERAVRGFEELRRRNPRLATAEEDQWRAASAYGAIREHQGEVVLQKGLFERHYRTDKAVVETFFALGQSLRAEAYGFEVLASYPDTQTVISDWYALSNRYATLKVKEEDPRTKRPRERAMLREAAESLREFIANFPASAYAPEAQFAVVTALEALGDSAAEGREAEQFQRRYPKSHLLDDAILKSLEADFRRGDYLKVLKEAPRLIEGEFLRPDGKFGRSEHADTALYLMAKSHHARGEIGPAAAAYARLADRMPDAAEALAYLTGRELSAPPLVVIPLPAKPELEITSRNVEKLSLRAYRVDLPVLFALRKDPRQASGVKLTGIDPVRAWEEKLEGGPAPRKARIAIPAQEKGAYLVVGRVETAAAGGQPGTSVAVEEFSTVVLRSDLEIDGQRIGDKLRVNVFRRAPDGKRSPAAGAYVRISDGQHLRGAGAADPRGIFEALVPPGKAAVLAEADGHFALYEE